MSTDKSLAELIAELDGDLLRVGQLCDVLEVSPKTVYAASAEGRMPAPITIGRQRRWYKAELVEWALAKEAQR